MDSLSMNNLASSLPPPARNDELNVKFKDAALSITTLYRASLAAQQRAHSAGYAAALQDVLAFVQAGVASGMDVGAVMDWAEARAAAVHPDDDDDDPAPALQLKLQKRIAHHPTTATAKENRRSKHSSTSPSPPPPSKKHPHAHRDDGTAPPSPVLGTKRRHAALLDHPLLPPPALSVIPEQRARKGKPKSARVPNPLPPLFGGGLGMDVGMDVEEPERERKRAARR